MPSPAFNMKMKNNLKYVRERADIPQQDIASLLDMKAPNLIRYENGQRNPTPEVILTYHILFGATLNDLFLPLVKKVKQNLVHRSLELIELLKVNQSPKSNKRIAYLREIVNLLSQEQEYESRI
ncbi:MAG: helix-turn-helix transcriptional regulator [bacterium]|nr:helix-turn-helix transcriptional regulator [bacterium]